MGLSKIIISSLFENAGIKINEDLTVNDDTFFRDVLLKGSIGLGDSYIEGKWDSDNIDILVFKILSQGVYQKVRHVYNGTRLIGNKFVNFQDRNGSKKVINEHYDLPAEFYAGFLDPFFQYTCGFFDNTDDLNIAQEKKMHLICQKLGLEKGSRVLDIGGGWGGLARFMKEMYGAKPTVITLSKEQAKHIKDTTQGIEVWLNDYRDIPDLLKESFDAVSAIGIFEHIGHKNYSDFMRIVNQSLKEDGRFLLQTLFTPYSTPSTNRWLNKHIFPNGELPPVEFIENSAANYFNAHNNSNNSQPHFQELTKHYYPTLLAWDKNLRESLSNGEISMPEKKERKWHYYFMSCAGAIKAEHMRVGQFLYTK
jgi:cyclopropane-fatty-acyl-phospholipid synthase